MSSSEDNSGGQVESQNSGRAMAAVETNDLRSVFHLLVGKPDSTQQMFKRRVKVRVNSIVDLHERMLEKLSNHRTDGIIATVHVSFDDKSSIEFGTWAEFEQHRWTGPKVTKEVRLRWEFLASIDGYEIPQRHTVTVKLSPNVKPFDVMRAVFSKEPEEMDTLEIENVPVTCRIDFVNHILSKELLAVVDEWVKGLEQPVVANTWFNWFEKHDDGFCGVIRYSAPVLAAAAAFMSLSLIFPDGGDVRNALSTSDAIDLARWALLSMMLIYVIERSSTALSLKVSRAIQRHGNFTMFQLTNGDSESERKLSEKNKKQVRKFLLNSGFSLLLNIISGVVVYIGWPIA